MKFSFVRETLQVPPPLNIDPNRMKELIQDTLVAEKEKRERMNQINEMLGKIPVKKKISASEELWKRVRSSDAQKQFRSDYDKWLTSKTPGFAGNDKLAFISNEVPANTFFETAVEETLKRNREIPEFQTEEQASKKE